MSGPLLLISYYSCSHALYPSSTPDLPVIPPRFFLVISNHSFGDFTICFSDFDCYLFPFIYAPQDTHTLSRLRRLFGTQPCVRSS